MEVKSRITERCTQLLAIRMNLAPKQLSRALQPPVQEPYETVAFLISAGLWSPKMLSFHVVVIFQITIPWKYFLVF